MLDILAEELTRVYYDRQHFNETDNKYFKGKASELLNGLELVGMKPPSTLNDSGTEILEWEEENS